MNPPQVLGIEELLGWNHALARHDEPLRILLMAAQRQAKLEQFGWYRVEPGSGNVFAIFGHGGFVSSTLISHQGLIQRTLGRQAFVNTGGEEICVAKGIANSKRHERVLVAAGVAYERPAWSEWTAQKVWQVGGAIEALFAASFAHSLGESGDQIHNTHELAFDISFHRIKFVDGPGDKDREQ